MGDQTKDSEGHPDSLDHRAKREKRLELAIRGTSDGLWTWEISTGEGWWSPRLRELIGFEEHEVPSGYESWKALLHPDDAERTLLAVRRHLDGEGAYAVECRMQTKERDYRWFLARGLAERDASGAPVRMAGSIQDITERKAVEEALRMEKEFSDCLINSSLDGILAYDPEFRYTVWNPAMERISGILRSETLGRCAFDVFPFLVESGEDRFFKEALAGKTLVTRDRPYTVPESGHQGFFEGYYSPLRRKSGEIIGGLAIIRDITERRRAESERARLEEQLRQSQKMDAIGQLGGGVAHDFNNILTAILGNTEIASEALLEGSDALDLERARQALERIRKASEHATLLTKQLLAFSRSQPISPEPIDLKSLVANFEHMLRPLIREDISLAIRLGPDPADIFGDVGQIEQVIMNLVLNSQDAMPGGGTLAIECSNVDLDAAAAAANLDASPGPHTVLAVSDTGSGMDTDTVKRIFEPFYTTKPLGKGTGLGLSIVYGIVRRFGGHLEVESEPGRGTATRIFFPTSVPGTQPAARERARPPARGQEVILVCEDDDSVRQVACQVLQAAGYTVLEADNGEQALQLATNHGGDIDLLLSDVVMPVMNGRELGESLTRLVPGARVLYISGYTDDVLGPEFEPSASTDFLRKPFDPSTLLRRVRDLLDRSPQGSTSQVGSGEAGA